MKKIAACSLVAAAAALLSLASPAMAGVLTLDDGSPTYTPPGDFTTTNLAADVVGGLIHLEGRVTVLHIESDTATIEISGTYSAQAEEIFSIAYKFLAYQYGPTVVDYTLSGTVKGAPIPPIEGTIENGLHVYEGTIQMPFPFPLPDTGDFTGTLTLVFVPIGNQPAASYSILDLIVPQIDFQLDPLPVTVIPPSQSQNISTRANVGSGDNVLIGGIIITGNDTKQVVLRAIGPSLSGAGVTDPLADPALDLFDSAEALVASNDNWMDNSADDQMILTDNNLAPSDNLESALVANLEPGAYTAIVRGVGDTTGVALVEAYDLDNGATDSLLGNISTRGFVGTGEDVMIGGFILGGSEAFAEVIVRGIGPSLADFGVTDALGDPFLELRDSEGTLIDANDNWMDHTNMQTVVDRGLAPSNPNESAIYDVLPIGAYTAILSGVGGDTIGVGLVEVYNVNP